MTLYTAIKLALANLLFTLSPLVSLVIGLEVNEAVKKHVFFQAIGNKYLRTLVQAVVIGAVSVMVLTLIILIMAL